MFRGREQAHPERGRALLQRLFEDLGGLAVIESQPLQEGRNMSMLLAPTRDGGEAGRRKPVGRGSRRPMPPATALTPADALRSARSEPATKPAADSQA